MTYELLPPSDPRVLSSIAPFDIETFKKQEKIELKEFVNNMFETMQKYGGIGLSANQVGKPYRMFIMGGHPEIHKSKKWTCINPTIVEASKQTTKLKEQEEDMIGIVSRCYQHELDHMDGIVFTEKVSKFKLDYALKKRDKEIKRVQKLWQTQSVKN